MHSYQHLPVYYTGLALCKQSGFASDRMAIVCDTRVLGRAVPWAVVGWLGSDEKASHVVRIEEEHD